MSGALTGGGGGGEAAHTSFCGGGEDHRKIEYVGEGAMAQYILPEDIWLYITD